MTEMIIAIIAFAAGAAAAWHLTRSGFSKRAAESAMTADWNKRLQDELNAIREKLQQETNRKITAETLLSKESETVLTLREDLWRAQEKLEKGNAREKELGNINASIQAKYDEALNAVEEQKKFVTTAQQGLKDAFHALSADALDKNNQSFLDLAKTALEIRVSEAKGELENKKQAIDTLVKPLGDSLFKMDEKINALEAKREGAYGNISALMDQIKITTGSLDKETKNLVSALKTSHTRGRYGEIALKRLVEFSGMVDQCDFIEQQSADSDSGKLRPDMIIKLPGNRQVVVDSKVPLSSYLRIFETDDTDQHKILLSQHVSAIKIHLKQLSGKAYWDQFKDAPDFVILFMQIESSFGAALQVWPELIEEALNNRIIVATPTTLITVLRSIGYSWNQLKTMENIEEIRDAAVEMYERSNVLLGHLVNMGNGINSTINHYNRAVGSLETNFLPQGRKIQQLSQAYIKAPLKSIDPIELNLRSLSIIPSENREIHALPE